MNVKLNSVPMTWQQRMANPFAAHHPEAAAYEGRFAEPAQPAVIDATAEVVRSEPVPASQGNPVLTRVAQDFTDASRLGLMPRAAVVAGSLLMAGCDKVGSEVGSKAMEIAKEELIRGKLLVAVTWLVGFAATTYFTIDDGARGFVKAVLWPAYAPFGIGLWGYRLARKAHRLYVADKLYGVAESVGIATLSLGLARLEDQLSKMNEIASRLSHSVPYIREVAVRALRRAIIKFDWHEAMPKEVCAHLKKLIAMWDDPEESVRDEARRSVKKIVAMRQFTSEQYVELLKTVYSALMLAPPDSYEGVLGVAVFVARKIARRDASYEVLTRFIRMWSACSYSMRTEAMKGVLKMIDKAKLTPEQYAQVMKQILSIVPAVPQPSVDEGRNTALRVLKKIAKQDRVEVAFSYREMRFILDSLARGDEHAYSAAVEAIGRVPAGRLLQVGGAFVESAMVANLEHLYGKYREYLKAFKLLVSRCVENQVPPQNLITKIPGIVGIQHLLWDRESERRHMGARMLGVVAEHLDPVIVAHQAQRLLPLLSDQSREVREAALSALGVAVRGAWDSAVRNDLIAAVTGRMGDEEVRVRYAAGYEIFNVIARGGRVDDSVIEHAVALLVDGDAYVRSRIHLALSTVSDRFDEEAELKVKDATMLLLMWPQEYARRAVLSALACIKFTNMQRNDYFGLFREVLEIAIRRGEEKAVDQLAETAAAVRGEDECQELYRIAQDAFKSAGKPIPASVIGLMK